MKLKSTFTLILICIIAIVSFSFKKETKKRFHPLYSSGVANVLGVGYTGGPFENGGATCSNCHGGGIYNPTVSLSLLDASTNIPATTYLPGAAYILRMNITPAAGTPQFGFQITSVKQSDNSNLNTWGSSFPTNVNNVVGYSSGRNYIEHNARLASGIINIPWTAPSTGFGEVTFYGVGNAVNANGGTSGDNAANTVLTIPQAVVPITLLSFTGKEENGRVKLYWETAQELNNEYFNIEHSLDGNNFKIITKINSKGNTSTGHNYELEDKQEINGQHFYKLKQVDLDGKFTYSPIVVVKISGKKISIFPNPVVNEININGGEVLKNIQYKIINQAGKIVLSGNLNANKINVGALTNGTYFVTINNENGILLSEKFLKQ